MRYLQTTINQSINQSMHYTMTLFYPTIINQLIVGDRFKTKEKNQMKRMKSKKNKISPYLLNVFHHYSLSKMKFFDRNRRPRRNIFFYNILAKTENL